MPRFSQALQIPRIVRTPFLIASLISASLTLTALTLFFRLPPQIPLFYSMARPEQYLANREWIFVFPCFSFLVTIGHMVLARIVWKLDEFLLQMFAWITVLVQVLLALAMIRIIMIIS